MKKNSISFRSYLVNGDLNEILENATPKEAIETYSVLTQDSCSDVGN
jgi:hypothetical protein